MEYEKLQQEKTEIQRAYVMVGYWWLDISFLTFYEPYFFCANMNRMTWGLFTRNNTRMVRIWKAPTGTLRSCGTVVHLLRELREGANLSGMS